ncbi:SDR family oxidoreductase [Mucilaginibacter pocheonensis]|uniref:NAD(P)-dependent dehydrogenase (Short-subunit alcohol dehydrogenase family) n=1 Tax=Mucilaginibacter pocheonensis TaxID=398050 RepID=A0ABU1T5V4_9SPHI|nr:SDR family oxidoreductase [Mucilaginibacter pocheonensis]MDR6940780.1 NAD(P)-dependent dehydrogenase (short-subunit alcohol dehydrogenase family) [Mucilaginibacter pocheonensis]
MNKQTVLITGANKGIGLETARQLAKAGYYIFLGSRDQDRGQIAVAQLQSEGYTDIELLLIDVADEQSVQQAHDELAKRIDHLDVLINNAGIPGTFPQTPTTVSDDVMKQVFEVNFFGVIRTVRIFIDLLKKAENPRIVNVTSDLGSLTYHNDPNWEYYHFKSAAYGPSKTALNAYTVALAFELKDQVKVNMVNPGYTNTEFNHNQGPKKVEDGAAPIVEYAMLDKDGPTGKYISDYGETPW